VARYAYDVDRQAVVVTWPSGAGDTAITILGMGTVAEDLARRLARGFTSLSAALWRTYTHPASGARDDLSPNTEGWRRMHDREAFTKVPGVLRAPNLPEHGGLLQSYIPVEEAAHSVGRVLHEIGPPVVLDAAVADVEVEIVAVECAERGDFSGRATQAIELTRADASPVQVAAADSLLEADPFGSSQLFCEVDPTSAAVAAAHWLAAAASVAADVSGYDPATVVEIADNIEAIPTETPTEALVRISAGESPLDAVLGMVGAAMTVAKGEIPDISDLSAALKKAEELVSRYGVKSAELEIRLVPLDPARPAPDMLEDLVTGIHGCFLIWNESASDDEEDKEAEEVEPEMDSWDERRRDVFAAAVRAVARSERRRIGL
jgi:hypothetical protein